MEASTRCSSPLSVNSRFDPLLPPHRPTSAIFNCHGRRRLLSTSTACSTSYSSSYLGVSISPSKTLAPSPRKRSSRRVISAVFERFTERSIKAVIFSQREAKSLGDSEVLTHHLLLGLIAESGSDGFLGSGITVDAAREAVRSIWPDGDGGASASGTDQVAFASSTKRVFEAAVEYSRNMGHNFIAPEHIATALFTVDDVGANLLLKRLGANADHLAAVAVVRLQGELAKDGREPQASTKPPREKLSPPKATMYGSSAASKDKNALERFCVDLTERASNGIIDPVIGRDAEVQRIIQILSRKSKCNPILLGEAGVGKTAIAEGLAVRVAQGNVPVFLLTKRIMSLDTGLLIAGANERGELEGRVTSLIRDIKNSGDVVLFIDEVHTLVGSSTVGKGNKGSGLDIANLLKPALGRGEFQCIASTTMDEFRMHFEKDKALARRFQPVLVSEPSQEDTLQILLGLREKYEAHHKCKYTNEALQAAVSLSAQYIPDRQLPDKAIDLIDEAGSKANMESFKRRKEQLTSVLSDSPNDYWQEIRAVSAMQEVVLASKRYKNYNASGIEEDSKLANDSSPNGSNDEPAVVGSADIAAVASLWSGIPVTQLTTDEREVLMGLDEQLKKLVIGQDEAVEAISRAVKRSRVGLKDPKRPIAAMMFCGPTGVGKTELTKTLAECYFGSEAAMLRLDMSEYMERHTVSKLIGSPPGYVGYGEGGTLTEAIRKRPFTVVLLDEIEKAHPDIFNILLQILEDGHLTDSQGRRVSFKNALVVMTSNVGSTAISKGRHNSIGFFTADDNATSYAGLKSLVMEELRAYFRPELLNRLDEVVVFHPLEKNQMNEILELMLVEVKGRLASLGIKLEISEAVLDLVCEQGFDRSYGARPLRRAITNIIEDRLSEAILSGGYEQGDTAFIDLDDSGNPVVTNKLSCQVYCDSTSSWVNINSYRA